MDIRDGLAIWYDQALALSRAAFAHRHYAVAFHAIAAALHCANDLGDDARLMEVGALAREQAMWLDDHDPSDPLSAESAALRGSHSLWASLGREVATRRRLLEQRRLIQRRYSYTSVDADPDTSA
ncbi:MAG TPA: hypothetical protein VGP82_10295 [Ktedonobacterales bacterium]|jgi:hypothetical protein|nr:hypothetical protein [Ktedonobacterales bacterium]